MEHPRDGHRHLVGPVPVRLVYHVNVGDLHHSGFQCLDRVSRFGVQRYHHRVRHTDYAKLGLPNTHSLDQYQVGSGGVERPDHAFNDPRQPARLAPRSHAADKDPGIQVVALHPDAVAQ